MAKDSSWNVHVTLDFADRFLSNQWCNDLEIEWYEFYHDNKAFNQLYRDIADELYDDGYRHFSSTMVINRIRWMEYKKHAKINSKSEFLVNDHVGAYYARWYNMVHLYDKTPGGNLMDPRMSLRAVSGEPVYGKQKVWNTAAYPKRVR